MGSWTPETIQINSNQEKGMEVFENGKNATMKIGNLTCACAPLVLSEVASPHAAVAMQELSSQDQPGSGTSTLQSTELCKGRVFFLPLILFNTV